MPAPVIYYIRHGETAWNAEGRFQGARDIPLNDLGRTQAVTFRAVFSPTCLRVTDRIRRLWLSSQAALSRARLTMELMRGTLNLPPDDYAIDDRLREIGYGQWEGLTLPEMQLNDAATFASATRTNGGRGALGRKQAASRCGCGVVRFFSDTVAVAHGGTMRADGRARIARALEAAETADRAGRLSMYSATAAEGSMVKRAPNRPIRRHARAGGHAYSRPDMRTGQSGLTAAASRSMTTLYALSPLGGRTTGNMWTDNRMSSTAVTSANHGAILPWRGARLLPPLPVEEYWMARLRGHDGG